MYQHLWCGLVVGQVTEGRTRAKLLRDGPSYCGEGRTTGQDVSTFVVRAGCGPSYCGADYGLSYCGGGGELLRGGANYGTGCINICGAGWLWAKLLRGGLRAKLLRGGASYCGEGRTTGQDVSIFVVRAGCGPSYCGAGCRLNCNVRAAGCGLRFPARTGL